MNPRSWLSLWPLLISTGEPSPARIRRSRFYAQTPLHLFSSLPSLLYFSLARFFFTNSLILMFILFFPYRLFKIDVHIIFRYIHSYIPRSHVKITLSPLNYVIYIKRREAEINVQSAQILGYMLRFFWFFITNFTISIYLKDVPSHFPNDVSHLIPQNHWNYLLSYLQLWHFLKSSITLVSVECNEISPPKWLI